MGPTVDTFNPCRNHFAIADHLLNSWKSPKQAVKKMTPFVLSDEQLPPLPSLAPKLDGNVHAQTESPLFSVIPAEVRNRIFSIALTAYDDKSNPYQPQNWFYRPGWHFHPKISTTLLRTCKRIFLDNHLLPLELNSHTFWSGSDRAPPPHYFSSAFKEKLPSGRGRQLGNWAAAENFRGFFNKLTADQRGAVGELHFFLQQYYLEWIKFSPPLDPDSSRPIAAKKLKITLRHQDWHGWENDERLGLCPWNRGRTFWYQMDASTPTTTTSTGSHQGWGAQLQYIQGLEQFELELETLAKKKWQMDGIVERAKRWAFPLKEDKFLRWDSGLGVRESWWEEDDEELHSEVPLPDEVVVPVVPSIDGTAPLRAENVAMLDGSGSLQQDVRDDTLSQCSIIAQADGQTGRIQVAKRHYYVVSLTWKVRASAQEEVQCCPGAAR